MYRCCFCHKVSEARAPRMVYSVLKANGDIARELPVCLPCRTELIGGRSEADLRAEFQSAQPSTPSLPPKSFQAPPPPPPPAPAIMVAPVPLPVKPVRMDRFKR